MIPPPQSPSDATDIFSISDQVLADRLQFIEEIGFGNWGSVWLCRPKSDSSSSPLQESKIAVKLVHRSKTSTTAARVRSLWNEMKVVRALKHEPHPSIIPFYSFIITPSYALITMAYHPRLVTVEVSETHAKEWFRSLLSGIDFLHKRGVVHNDIKPANIMLSNENVPVLVDFGFAERYDVQSPEAFHSNLSYGTPESDVWSLGVTFFEILIGRTPFEYSEGEQFSTKEDLEKYWSRTLRGKWVGTWNMSKAIEKLLRRMILPNADLRCNASQAMEDPYWTQTEVPGHAHRKSASVSHSRSTSLTFEGIVSPWSSRAGKDKEKEKVKAKTEKEKDRSTAVGKENASTYKKAAQAAPARSSHARSASQPKLHIAADTRGVSQTKRQHAVPSVFSALSPIKHSPPPATETFAAASSKGKEHDASKARSTRKPLGPRSPASSPQLASPPGTLRGHASKENSHARHATEKEHGRDKDKRRSHILRDVTSARKQDENVSAARKADKEKENEGASKAADTSKDSVRSRMKEWERERERLKERMREVDEERDHEHDGEREHEKEKQRQVELERERAEEEQRERERERLERERERIAARERARREGSEREYVLPKISVGPALTPPETALASPLSPLFEEPSEERSVSPQANESNISVLKQGLRMSIGNAVRLYKSSTQLLGRSTPALTLGSDNADDESRSLSEQPSWDDEERQEQESRMDRMTLWIQNVEKVVDEARQNFAASTSSAPAPPALPLAPMSCRSSHSRSGRGNRVPRRILAANQIFLNEYEPETYRHSTAFSMDRSVASMSPLPSPSILNTMNFAEHTLPTIPSEQPSRLSESDAVDRSYAEPRIRGSSTGPSAVLLPETPSRKRRATVVTRSPEDRRAMSLEIDVSPSKRREKSRSHGDLLRPITPITKLEFELQRLAQPTPTPRLSAVVDKNLFIAPSPVHRTPTVQIASVSTPPRQQDELTASPLQVDTYPNKTAPKDSIALDTPAKRHLEGVYDRFLMSTTGVKRSGKGYQSENVCAPVENIRPHSSMAKRSQKFFTARRQMPPPVSSDDLRRSSSIDEFGAFMSTPAPNQEQNKNTIAIVRKAFKAIVTGKPNARTTKPVWH
ncbi:hypothetical protein C8Q80DRAFT_1266285 [Daedaleopsis nitida]|nr:hypothetical protein C8Q80DRAFT_1266285 [Daedaleopsis nitida]